MDYDVHANDIERHASLPELSGVLRTYERMAERDGRVPLEAFLDALEPHVLRSLETLKPVDGDYLYLSFGADVAAAAGFDMAGRRVSDLPTRVGGAYASLLDRVRRERRPLLAFNRSILAPQLQLWERVVFPARAPCGGDRLATFIKPRGAREDLLSAVLEASRDGVMALRAVRDESGRMVDAVVTMSNNQAAEYSGHPIWRLVDGHFKNLFPGLVARGAWERCVKVVEERAVERFEINISHRRLDTWLRVTAVPLEDGFVLSFSDVTDLKYAIFEAECSREELSLEIERRQALESELRRLSHTDDLTGVLNRRGFSRAVNRDIAMARRYGHTLSLLAIDLDHFKRVNDCYGHAAGDTVLMAAAALFVETTRQDVDTVGRVGGEEFMILLPQTGLEGAMILGERMRAALAEMPINVGTACLNVTASIGARELGPGEDAEQLLIGADDALYRAKADGRNRVVAYSRDQEVAAFGRTKALVG